MKRFWSCIEESVRKWRDEIPSLPQSFFGDSAGEDGLSDSVLMPLILGCVLTGLIGGFLIGLESSRPPSTVLETTYESGYDDGFSDGISSLPDSQPELLFREEGVFNRSIAVVYPDQDLSYECVVSRRTVGDAGGEWVIDRQAYKYNGTVECNAVDQDLISEYDDPAINNTLLRNEVTNAN